MEKILTTDGAQAKDSFHQWHSFCDERIVPMRHQQLVDDSFFASAEGSCVGSLTITKMSLGNLGLETTSQTIRHQKNRSDNIFISLILDGAVKVDQNGRSTIDKSGDLGVRDQNTPWRIEYNEQAEMVAIELPRDRLEALLGPARNFSGMTVNGDLPSATLARSFLRNLMRLGDKLAPDAAERMATIGIDLIVASIAERMALETPKPLLATTTVQHAKAYIDAHLSDPELNSIQIAAAVQVSVRYLQERFRERGRDVATWIWERRLETAAQRLCDPACLHQPLGLLAYGCGFTSQAHFSRRFRGRFGMSPREYRQNAFTAAATHDHQSRREGAPVSQQSCLSLTT